MTTKEDLRRLVDQLLGSELIAARRFLEYLRDSGDPVLRAFLEAPGDHEREAEEEERVAVAPAYGHTYEDII